MNIDLLVVFILALMGTMLMALAFWLKYQTAKREADIASLMYSLTHDELSNPLQSAMTALDNLNRKNKSLNSESSVHLDDLTVSLGRISNTTKNLRALALVDMPKVARVRERINAVSAIQSLVVENGEKAETEGVRLIYEGDDNPIYVLEQKINLHRIFSNILDNAVKYVVGCEDACVVINVSQENRFLIVLISDNGKGMPADKVKSVGTAPQRPTAQNVGTKGSGLGMYLVNKLVKQAGGTLDVNSQLGVGTQVRVRIPSK